MVSIKIGGTSTKTHIDCPMVQYYVVLSCHKPRKEIWREERWRRKERKKERGEREMLGDGE